MRSEIYSEILGDKYTSSCRCPERSDSAHPSSWPCTQGLLPRAWRTDTNPSEHWQDLDYDSPRILPRSRERGWMRQIFDSRTRLYDGLCLN